MKQKIHPKYFEKTVVTCACGNTFTTGSTVESISVEICSNCHPFYTGKQKIIDTQGRVDRFKKMLEKKSAISEKVTKARVERSTAKKAKKEKASKKDK